MNGFFNRYFAEVSWGAVMVFMAVVRLERMTAERADPGLAELSVLLMALAIVLVPMVGWMLKTPPGFWPRARRCLAAIWGPTAALLVGWPNAGGYATVFLPVLSAVGGLVSFILVGLHHAASRRGAEPGE